MRTGSNSASDKPGDYNQDGVVDRLDYLTWSEDFATTGNLRSDGNQDGVVNLQDYLVWREALPQLVRASDGNKDGVVSTEDYDFWKGRFVSAAASSTSLAQTASPGAPRSDAEIDPQDSLMMTQLAATRASSPLRMAEQQPSVENLSHDSAIDELVRDDFARLPLRRADLARAGYRPMQRVGSPSPNEDASRFAAAHDVALCNRFREHSDSGVNAPANRLRPEVVEDRAADAPIVPWSPIDDSSNTRQSVLESWRRIARARVNRPIA